MLATRLLSTPKSKGGGLRGGRPTADRRPPPITRHNILHFHCRVPFIVRANSTHFFLRGLTVLGSCWQQPWTHGLLFSLHLQMNSFTPIAPHRWESLLNIDSGAQTCNISRTTYLTDIFFFFILSAYVQNPSIPPHRKVLQSHWASNLRALPVSASRSRSCLRVSTTTSCVAEELVVNRHASSARHFKG